MAEQAEDQVQDASSDAGQEPEMDRPGGGAPAQEPEAAFSEPAEDIGTGGKSLEIGNFRVFTDLRLPEFDMGHCKAYAADSLSRSDGRVFALVTDPVLPTRYDLLRFLAGVHIGGQIDLLDHDVAYWPPFGRKTMVLFYEKPKGGRVIIASGKNRSIDEQDIASVVVEPLMNVLQALSEKGLTHRSIRATNLFFADAEGGAVILGDCASGPPGFDQPLVYETAARMASEPAGRGVGTLADDLYALGMTLAELGIGRRPLAKMSDQEIMDIKLSKGSFQAVASQEKLPLVLILLRPPLANPIRYAFLVGAISGEVRCCRRYSPF